MEITIYATHKMPGGESPGSTYYSLERPELSSGLSLYINVSDYRLPEGYSVVRVAGKLRIVNGTGRSCQLAGAGESHPVLIDPAAPEEMTLLELEKVRDVTFAVLMEALLEEGSEPCW